MNGIDPIQLTDLRVRYEQHEFPAERPATESDLLSVLTDEALLGELVKRGVLTENAAGYYRQLKRVREMKQTAPPREGRPGIAARVDDDNTETE